MTEKNTQECATVGLSRQELKRENRCFKGTGGRSQENRPQGFRPAFSDTATGAVYLSRFYNGQLAPVHLLDGLPATLVAERTPGGRVASVKPSVIAGFVCDNRFYTRAQAARAAQAG